ncbi:MAG: DUF4399 domain-containing protein [Alphaproteobacteria bacterium GM7ARS4]|nr:DUF4399 domain-containing protein [Alphaproteobacteria bacterium GM7ARS4]
MTAFMSLLRSISCVSVWRCLSILCPLCLAYVAYGATESMAHMMMDDTEATDAPSVYFITPTDGAIVTSPVKVRFGLKNFGIAPAGIELEGTGHHHLVIRPSDDPEATALPEAGTEMAFSETLLHFGGGQTETELDLRPGAYVLRLVLGDAYHYPIPSLHSEPITITVK